MGTGGGFMEQQQNSASKKADTKVRRRNELVRPVKDYLGAVLYYPPLPCRFVVSSQMSRDKQTMLPVSVKQIHGATLEEGTYRIDNAEVHTVVVMGLVESMEEHSTNMAFKINDGTGTVEAKLWNEKDTGVSPMAARLASCQTNSFVRIVGALRDFENRKHVLIYDVRPLSDWNELTHHLFHIMFVHQQNTRGPLPGTHAAKSAVPTHSGFAAPQHGSGHGMAMQVDANEGPKALLLKAFSESEDYEGITIEQCKSYLGKNSVNLPEAVIRRMVTEMAEEGIIFSTTDEDHYAMTR